MKKNYFTKNLKKGLFTFILVFSALLTNTVTAQRNIAWKGTNGDWSTASNWNYPARTVSVSFTNNPELNIIAPFAANATDIIVSGNREKTLFVGLRVSGTGIAAGTTVTAFVVSTDKLSTTITISQPTTLASEVAGNNLLFTSDTVSTLDPATSTIAFNEISVGDVVSAFGVPQGAKVVLIDSAAKKITIGGNTYSGSNTVNQTTGVVTIGYINMQVKFGTPKTASAAPGRNDIAVISNGGNPTLADDDYYFAGLVISNDNTTGAPSTLTIGENVGVFVESSTHETLLVKGGNIINNGYLELKSLFSGGINHTSGAYAMTFGLPSVIPSVPTQYTYSGTGELDINTAAANSNSGGIYFNGFGTNGNLATYKLFFDGPVSFSLSATTTGTASTANSHLFRAIGTSGTSSCKAIIGGKGFDFGTAGTGGVNNGFLAISGGGIDVTIDAGTTINMFSNNANPTATFSMYSFGETALPSFIRNNGTFILKGRMQRSVMGFSAQNKAAVNFENNGILDIDVKSALAGGSGIAITNNGGATLPADVIVTNTGTMSIKTLLNGPSWGAPISMTTFSGAPNLILNNSGTLRLIGSNYNFGSRAFDPNAANAATITGASRIVNSGILETNQELRSFYTTNTSTGKITFLTTPETTKKIVTFTVLAPIAASVGTTYTDPKGNVHTVVVSKVTGTGTSLVTEVDSNIVNPVSYAAVVEPPSDASALTKTGTGAGDNSIVYTGVNTNGNNASFQALINSGVLITNPGNTAMTNYNGLNMAAETSVLSPGGDNGKGVVFYDNPDLKTGTAVDLNGTIKIQVSGNTAGGTDYDKIVFKRILDKINLSQATLDITEIYTPTEITLIDILTTPDDISVPYDDATNKSGQIKDGAPFKAVNGLSSGSGWEVLITGTPGKVQLYFDPANLSTSDNAFAKFKFNYYPNPTSNVVNISAEKNISKVDLYTITGQKVQSNTVNASQKQLNISSLQRGVYLMEVSIDNAKKTFKIVKQ